MHPRLFPARAIALPLLALLLAASASHGAGHEKFAASTRSSIGPLPVVVLRGSALERAEAFGALTARDFAAMLCDALLPALNRKSSNGWEEIVRLAEKSFAFPGEFKDQAAAFVRGLNRHPQASERISRALGRALEARDLLAIHAFPDLASSGRVPLGGCSSFSAWGNLTADGETITGRNLDYFTFAAVIPQLVIAQQPSEPGRQRTIELSVPGFLGASTVLNESGVFLALHDESGLPGADGNWIPRVLPLRAAIERARSTDALADIASGLRGARLAMGAIVNVSFPIANAGAIRPAVLEWDGNSAEGGVTVRQAGPGDAIFCTNHYLKRRETPAEGSTAQRFESMTGRVAAARQAGEPIDVRKAKQMLDAAAVRGEGSTYLSVIALPAKRELWVAVAPRAGASATDGEWTHVKWDDVFAK